MTKQYRLINNSLGWIIGIFASAIYIMTAEPTASWWDCGEYISTAHKMLVGHPPGAPTFQILGSVFSLFAGNDVTKIAFALNSMSAIASGMTIMFLFWTITLLGKKLVAKMGGMTPLSQIGIFGAALVGALTYTFSDTFWFSAVEGEVYALSSFFTALVFWCILKWDEEYDNRLENINPHRWLVLIAYLVGLSIGVHLLNLLTLPAIALIIYFKLSKNTTIWGVILTIAIISLVGALFLPGLWMIFIWVFITIPSFYFSFKNGAHKKIAEWGVLLTLGASFILLGVILYGIIPGIVNFAGKFEIFSVNTLGLPFNFGTIVYFLIIIGLIIWGLYYCIKKEKRVLAASILSFTFLLIGYSTFITLVIRSNANPTIDENNPEDAVSLLSYLNREQYGSNPLFYGESYNSKLIDYKDGTPVYVRDDKTHKYVVSNSKEKSDYVYDPADLMPFPRMWSRDKSADYISWLKAHYDLTDPADREEVRYLEKGKLPTSAHHKKFMLTYQFNYMYFRYFMWNFAGRQNDLQGRGDLYNGNWVTGISFIDDILVGKQDKLPESMERPGHNTFFMFPLILGIIGLIWYSRKDGQNSFVVGLLFLMTGLAIAFYLNMYAFQPRERDYAFAASFYAFAIWVGFGVFAIISWLEKIKNNKIQIASAFFAIVLSICLVPGVMAQQNWDDHDRSNKYTALAIAKNYLDSCAPNAIIFTLGDNDTFPLWYAQEVEGYRTDVRVCNLSLLNTSWYIDQMKRQAYNSAPLPISMSWKQYKDGTRDQLVLNKGNGEFLDIKMVMDYIKQPQFDSKKLLVLLPEGYKTDGQAVPGSFSIAVDKQKVLANGTVSISDTAQIVDKITWNIKDDGTVCNVLKAYLVMMDILANNNWERPIYFASTTGPEAWFGLEEYFQLEGLAYRLVPIKSQTTYPKLGRIDTDLLYDNLMNKFGDHSRLDHTNNAKPQDHTPYPYLWGGINDPKVYNNEDNNRLFSNIALMHTRLAQALIEKGDFNKAEKVLDQTATLFNPDVIPILQVYNFQYSMQVIDMIKLYFKINTPSAQQKGLKLANRLMDSFIETYDWFDQCDERTINIQSENIDNTALVLKELLKNLTPEQIAVIQPKLSKIKISKIEKYVLPSLFSNVSKNLSKYRSMQSADVNALQRETVNLLSSLYYWEKFYKITNKTNQYERIKKMIDEHIAALNMISPEYGNSFANFLFPERTKIQPIQTDSL
ncbi:MAG: rane protein [Bacteroidetes bacterium]|nr:rane protein [Bacteroidota bacterium]